MCFQVENLIFSFKLFIGLSLLVATVNCAQLQCQYLDNTFPEPNYECDGRITTSRNDYVVDNVAGSHVNGKGFDDIRTIIFKNVTMEVLPSKLNVWFKNYRGLAIISLYNFPNFRREQFVEYRGIDTLYAGNITGITTIPKDAFYELTTLTHLYLEGMTNMGNLDGDLLVNMPFLRVFSARGPNKITTIYPQFFRKQENTLQVVDFRGTNLLKVGYMTFDRTVHLEIARFNRAGCLNQYYRQIQVAQRLTADIRKSCEDVTDSPNEIMKSKGWLYGSSSSESN